MKNIIIFISFSIIIIKIKTKQSQTKRVESQVQNSPATHTYQKDRYIAICTYESRIHYPMTCCNYPFSVIWAIVNVSSSSRTFSASLTQKHQTMLSQESIHKVVTGYRGYWRGYWWAWVSVSVVQSHAAGGERACVSAADARLLAEWAPAEGRSSRLAAPAPGELTKNTNCACPLSTMLYLHMSVQTLTFVSAM